MKRVLVRIVVLLAIAAAVYFFWRKRADAREELVLSGSIEARLVEVGSLVGASRERVNQVMVEFRQKGYLSVDSSHHIQVHQPPALARLCR